MHFCMVASYITSVYLVTVFIAWSVALTKSLLNKDEISASRISGFCIYIYIWQLIWRNAGKIFQIVYHKILR